MFFNYIKILVNTIYKYRNEFILYLSSQEYKKEFKLKWNIIVNYILYPYLLSFFVAYYSLMTDIMLSVFQWCCGSCGYKEYYIGFILLVGLIRQGLNYENFKNKSKIQNKLRVLTFILYLSLFFIALYNSQPVVIDTWTGEICQRRYILIEPLIYASIALSTLLPFLFVIDLLLILSRSNFILTLLVLIFFLSSCYNLNVESYMSTLKTLMNQSHILVKSLKKIVYSSSVDCMMNSDGNRVPSTPRHIEALPPITPLEAGHRLIQGTLEMATGNSITGLERITTDQPMARTTFVPHSDGSCTLRTEQSLSSIDTEFRDTVKAAREKGIAGISKNTTETSGRLAGTAVGLGVDALTKPIEDWANNPSAMDIRLSPSECSRFREQLLASLRKVGSESDK